MDTSNCHMQPTTNIRMFYEIRNKQYTVLCMDELISVCALVERTVPFLGSWACIIAGGRSWLQRWMAWTRFLSSCHTTLLVALVKFTQDKRVFFLKLNRSWSVLCFNFMSRVFNSPMGCCGERQLIFFLHSRKRTHEQRNRQHTISHILLTIWWHTWHKSMSQKWKPTWKTSSPWCNNILIMEQTPISYSYHTSKMLDVKGVKTIHARASTMDTKHVTLTATVRARGKMLPPFHIFKR